MAMAEIVLRVRLIGGEHLDVTYEEDGGTQEEGEYGGAVGKVTHWWISGVSLEQGYHRETGGWCQAGWSGGV